MNAMTRTLTIVGLLAAGAAAVYADTATAEVTFEIHNFYNPSEIINDNIRVIAHNNSTGQNFEPDRGGSSLTLPVGNYTFSGRSQWCYLQAQTVDIAGDTDLVLLAGCE